VSSSSLGAELRKYRALAIALVMTLIIAVGLFVQFLSIDRTRAQTVFRTSADQAATISGMHIALLLERLETLGQHYLLLDASKTQQLSGLKGLGIDLNHLSICTRDKDVAHVLHTAKSQTNEHCNASSTTSDESFIIVRMVDQNAKELLASINSKALFNIEALKQTGLQVESDTLCLLLEIDGNYQQVGCHQGQNSATLPADFVAIANNAAWISDDVQTLNLKWKIKITPHFETVESQITLLPFSMFGIALVIGTLACLFAYKATDKKIQLEAHSAELTKQLEELDSLQHENSMLDQFAAMAAHDLQAPIRYIVSNAYILIEELQELDQQELCKLAQTQVEQGNRMRILVRDLLEFCRAGQGELAISPVNTRAVVEEEVRMLKAHDEYADTVFELGSLPASLNCDRDKLAHIIRNLMGNAVKFSQVSDKPKVSIGASRDELHGSWTFRIKDNGHGVSQEHHEQIFKPFARLESAAKGTGMGLAIVKAMLEHHGGSIWLDSSEKQSSTFCFTLPGAMIEKANG